METQGGVNFSLNVRKRRNPYEEKKRAEAERKKRDQEAAAEVFAEFVADFIDTKPKPKTFVRAGEDGEAAKRAAARAITADAALKDVFGDDDDHHSSHRQEKKKAKTNLELFKEELKMKELARSGQGGGTGASGATASSTAPFPPATSALPASAAPIGSHDTGDPATTNIFAGYLPPHFTEQTLCELFGAFGPLASVKIMWPRTPEEHARGRLTGFVAFMKREDAEECMSYYKTALVDGADLRVGWGKAVPLPPKPFYVHPKHSGPVETGLPFNAQPRQLSGPLDITTAVVKVIRPRDRAMRQLIHRTIDYVIRFGPEFEALVIQRTAGDEKYRFLVDHASPEHIYYRWKLFSLLQGEDINEWRMRPFRMFVGGPMWEPPPVPDLREGVEKGHLSTRSRERLEEMLDDLIMERPLIGEAMFFCINHADAAEDVVDCVTASLCHTETPIPVKLARLYLVSDILHNCTVPVRNASKFRLLFQSKMDTIFQSLHLAYKAITSRMRAEQFRRAVATVVDVWRDWTIFTPDFFEKLLRIFERGLESAESKPAGKAVGDMDGKLIATQSSAANDDDIDGVPMEDVAPPGRLAPAAKDDDDDDIDGIPME